MSGNRPSRSLKRPRWLIDQEEGEEGPSTPTKYSELHTGKKKGEVEEPKSEAKRPKAEEAKHETTRGRAADSMRTKGLSVDTTRSPTPKADGSKAEKADDVINSPYSRRDRTSKRVGEDEVGGIHMLIPKTRKAPPEPAKTPSKEKSQSREERMKAREDSQLQPQQAQASPAQQPRSPRPVGRPPKRSFPKPIQPTETENVIESEKSVAEGQREGQSEAAKVQSELATGPTPVPKTTSASEDKVMPNEENALSSSSSTTAIISGTAADAPGPLAPVSSNLGRDDGERPSITSNPQLSPSKLNQGSGASNTSLSQSKPFGAPPASPSRVATTEDTKKPEPQPVAAPVVESGVSGQLTSNTGPASVPPASASASNEPGQTIETKQMAAAEQVTTPAAPVAPPQNNATAPAGGIAAAQQMAAMQFAMHSGPHKWAHRAGAPIPVAAAEVKPSQSSGAGGSGAAPGWASSPYAALATPPIPAVRPAGSVGSGPVGSVSGPSSTQIAAPSTATAAAPPDQKSDTHSSTSITVTVQQSNKTSTGLSDVQAGIVDTLQSNVLPGQEEKSEPRTETTSSSSLSIDPPPLQLTPMDSGRRDITGISGPKMGKLVMWTPVDDALLKNAVEAGLDFPTIAQVLPFTSDFSIKDVEERWYSMLYDPVISMEVAIELSALTTPAAKLKLDKAGKRGKRRTLADPNEETCSAAELLHHKFTAEAAMELGLKVVLEAETQPSHDSGPAQASLDGPHGHYLVFTNQFSLGRRTASSNPEIDLSLEGEANTVSRKHAVLRKDAQTNSWSIVNVGRATIGVNGQQIPSGSSSELAGKSLLTVGGIRLVFDELTAN